jgi:hypothetical protein
MKPEQQLTTDIVMLARTPPGKVPIVYKEIKIPQSYYDSMKKYESDYDPMANKKSANHYRFYKEDPFTKKPME